MESWGGRGVEMRGEEKGAYDENSKGGVCTITNECGGDFE